MAGLLDSIGGFFSDDARQARTRWRDEQADKAWRQLVYYAGPTGIPDRLAALGGALDFTDAGDIKAVADANRGFVGNPSLASGLNLFNTTAAAALPFVGAKMYGDGVNVLDDALSSGMDDIASYLGDESGAFRAWHGSPHDFDKFSLDKIGTGEGAQAYGHGLYFAESPGVARSYRDALSNTDAPLAVWKRADGSEIDALDVPGGVAILRGEDIDIPHSQLLERAKRELARASSVKNSQLREIQTAKAQSAVDWLNDNPVSLSSHPERGRLYEVEIDANPEDFLDWDKPLSEQPMGAMLEGIYPTGLPGGDVYQMMMHDNRNVAIARGENAKTTMPSIQARASEDLKSLGIPGIRYKDQGSRGADGGTSNYVVFDDSIINILKKYGILTGGLPLWFSQEEQG